MEDEAGILQQRVQLRPVQRRRDQPGERVRREQRKGQERHRDHRLHGQHPGLQAGAQIVTKAGDAGAIQRQHQHPQQHRAFVVAPGGRQPIGQRLAQRTVVGDQRHRKIRLAEQRHQTAEGDGDQHGLARRGSAPERHQRGIPPDGPQHRQHRLGGSDQQGEDQGEMADFGKHGRRGSWTAGAKKTATLHSWSSRCVSRC